MSRVAIACGMDLLHSGHLDHLEKAGRLVEKAGRLDDELVIIVCSDDAYWRKDFCLIPLESRLDMAARLGRWLGGYLGISVSVVASIDKDGTCAETLRLVRPSIFAKGGDRVPTNMPAKEIDVCKEIGCEIRYEVGDLLGSRSRYFADAMMRVERYEALAAHLRSCQIPF